VGGEEKMLLVHVPPLVGGMLGAGVSIWCTKCGTNALSGMGFRRLNFPPLGTRTLPVEDKRKKEKEKKQGTMITLPPSSKLPVRGGRLESLSGKPLRAGGKTSQRQPHQPILRGERTAQPTGRARASSVTREARREGAG